MGKKFLSDVIFWAALMIIIAVFCLNLSPSGVTAQIVDGVPPVWAESGEIINSGRETSGEYVFYRFDGSPGGRALLANTDMPEEFWKVFDAMSLKPGQVGLIKVLGGEIFSVCVSDTQGFIDPEDDPTIQEVLKVKMPLRKQFGLGAGITEVITEIKKIKL